MLKNLKKDVSSSAFGLGLAAGATVAAVGMYLAAKAHCASCKKMPLYPSIPAIKSGYFKAKRGSHEIYYEVAGNPHGKPVVVIHGGPGGGICDSYRQYHDPSVYMIVLMDQRGCGKSKVAGKLAHEQTAAKVVEDNTTWHLIEDLEQLRTLLGISKWQLFGGSWGSTLALAYAIKHPEVVTELVIRGIFTCRKSEIDFYYQDGTRNVFPQQWADLVSIIPAAERGDVLKAFHKRIHGANYEESCRAAVAWSVYEGSTSKLIPEDSLSSRDWSDPKFAKLFAGIETHYFVNKAFFESDAWLLDNAYTLKNIPMTIVQGQYDLVCPATTAWELKQRCPWAEFKMVPAAGHSMGEKGIAKALVAATDKYRPGTKPASIHKNKGGCGCPFAGN